MWGGEREEEEDIVGRQGIYKVAREPPPGCESTDDFGLWVDLGSFEETNQVRIFTYQSTSFDYSIGAFICFRYPERKDMCFPLATRADPSLRVLRVRSIHLPSQVPLASGCLPWPSPAPPASSSPCSSRAPAHSRASACVSAHSPQHSHSAAELP